MHTVNPDYPNFNGPDKTFGYSGVRIIGVELYTQIGINRNVRIIDRNH